MTLKKFKGPSDPENSNGKIGDYLESLLFGGRQGLYSGGAEILLNIDNWNLPIDEFQSNFQSMQEDCRANGEPICALTVGKGMTNYVKFGRCGMPYRSSHS